MRYVRFVWLSAACALWTYYTPRAHGFTTVVSARTTRHPSRVGMAYLEGYYEVGAGNIQRRWGADVAQLQGLRLDRVMIAQYSHTVHYEWNEMEPFVLEFSDGTALSVDHTDFSKLTITVNKYNTTEDHEEKYAEDPYDRLDWRPTDEILPLLGRVVDFASFVVWVGVGPTPTSIAELLSGDSAFGMVALRLDPKRF